MAEGSTVPEICLLQCLPTHLGKTITGVWFHVDFLLPVHASYWKLILPSLESPATGLLSHVLRNHFQKFLGGNKLAELLALVYSWDRGAVCRTRHTLFCELSSCVPIQLVLVTGFAKSYRRSSLLIVISVY
jgi:hypothetical protein